MPLFAQAEIAVRQKTSMERRGGPTEPPAGQPAGTGNSRILVKAAASSSAQGRRHSRRRVAWRAWKASRPVVWSCSGEGALAAHDQARALRPAERSISSVASATSSFSCGDPAWASAEVQCSSGM